jgi:hypothetical protein
MAKGQEAEEGENGEKGGGFAAVNGGTVCVSE